MRKYELIIFTFIVIFSSCSFDQRLQESLLLSANNRTELETVLKYYEFFSQKRQAAEFLIENMPLHGTDIDSLDSAFLIENIEKAFAAWEQAPWHKEVEFKQFCHYILPYRFGDEPVVKHWRDSLVKEYAHHITGITDMKQAFAVLSHKIGEDLKKNKTECKETLDVVTMKNHKLPICKQRCLVVGSAMRALGLPVAYDFVGYWANYSSKGHSWVSLIGNDGETCTMQREDSLPTSRGEIDASLLKPKALPEGNFPYRVDSLKRVAKVYRKNFFLNEEQGGAVEDVSAHYQLTECITIKTCHKEQFAHLCVFRTGEDWIPVIKSRIKGGKCTFRNIGAEVVYLPVVITEDGVEPIDNPFILEKGGSIRKLSACGNNIDMKLSRKYPLMASVTNWWYDVMGGCFEAGSDSTFCDARLLHRIEDFPTFRNVVHLNPPVQARCMRYRSLGQNKEALAELEFYSGGKELCGKPKGRGQSVFSRKRAFDHDQLSISNPEQPEYWVGMDFERTVTIDSIIFFPRNDDNFVMPGEEYELFCWRNDKWQSLGRRYAEDWSLEYKDTPADALYLLRNLNKGKEERIFTYEDGKQRFW